MPKTIPLTQGQHAIVDDADYEWLSRYKWYSMKSRGRNWYARTTARINGKRKKVSMARMIMRAPKHLQVDHINLDTLDNRCANLRLCTHSQNKANGKKYRNSTSSYKGIYLPKDTNKWHAQIRVNNKQLYLGLYDSETEGARAYDRAAIEYHGEFARTNFPLSDYVNRQQEAGVGGSHA